MPRAATWFIVASKTIRACPSQRLDAVHYRAEAPYCRCFTTEGELVPEGVLLV